MTDDTYFRVPERYRVPDGKLASDASYGNNGAFRVPLNRGIGANKIAYVIASDGEGWEHVSVSLRTRCPWWQEMEEIKRLFWGDEALVMLLHMPRSQRIGNHSHCLHMWRPVGRTVPAPPGVFV